MQIQFIPDIFKLTIIATLVISGVIRGYYELRYMKVELIKVIKGTREKFFVKFVGMCITAPILVYLFTPYFDFANIQIPGIFRYIAAIGMLSNLYYFYIIHQRLGKNWSPILVISKNQDLITDGPYKKIRHPMYLSFWIHVSCMLFVSSNWIVGFAGILAFGTSYFIRINEEEQMMIDAFGDVYRDYKEKTNRIFPKLF